MTVLHAVQAPPRTTPTVRFEHVTKRFGPGPAVLEDVCLTVEPGEFVCLLGASGCGKSTMLNLAARLERPTSGAVHLPERRPALMFQDASLLPWLTAEQNVQLALRLRGVRPKERQARARELLSVVRLDEARHKLAHELSGGMRQRVALARALAQGSALLLMDEPFAALDAITRDVLHEELVRIQAEQRLTVLFVTHNVREAVRLGDRVLLLSSRPGRVVRSYEIDLPQPRRLDSPEVAALSGRITDELRAEIRRHRDDG